MISISKSSQSLSPTDIDRFFDGARAFPKIDFQPSHDFEAVGSTYQVADLHMNYLWRLQPQGPLADRASAIPCILAGRDSFAAILYFETISLADRSLQGEAPTKFANSMFRYKFHYRSSAHIRTVLDGVLNILLQ